MNRCEWFGCEENEYSCSHCIRCGAHYYEGFVFYEESQVWPLVAGWRWAKALPARIARPLFRKCEHCNRAMWLPNGKEFCCDRCAEEWIPF